MNPKISFVRWWIPDLYLIPLWEPLKSRISYYGLILLCALCTCQKAHAKIGPGLEQLKDQAASLALSDDIRWRRILFYIPSLVYGTKGMIDDPEFYLSPRGKWDPKAELDATLTAFFLTPAKGVTDQHALCRFPARRAFFEETLHLSPDTWPRPDCPRYEAWIKDRHYDRMSLVFSSYYPDNPASMFGHIFLRMHRPTGKRHKSDLLDDVINFAAFPDTENPFVYNLKGAFGGFPGRYSLMPYYLKIQEYNNLESRDLWEYPFKANTVQIDRIVRSLWEFGPHFTWYYYFDRNCAFVLLTLLETGDEQWQFVNPWRFWSTPSGSLQEVAAQPDIFSQTRFRPSAMSRYREHFDQLTPEEKDSLSQLVSAEKIKALASETNVPSKRRVIDTALEYIDYHEKLAGMRQATRFASLRGGLLDLRSSMPGGVADLLSLPEGGDPLRGHPGSWISVGGGRRFDENIGLLAWQPVLHDILSDDEGYARGMQIQIMPMEFSWRPSTNAPTLSRLDILSVLSLNPLDRLLHPSSWSFHWGWERQTLCSRSSRICSTGSLSAGRGVTGELQVGANSWLRSSVLLQAEVGGHDLKWNKIYGQIGPEWLTVASISKAVKIFLRSGAMRRFYMDDFESRFTSEGSAALITLRDLNLRGTLRWEQIGSGDRKANTWSWGGSLVYFF